MRRSSSRLSLARSSLRRHGTIARRWPTRAAVLAVDAGHAEATRIRDEARAASRVSTRRWPRHDSSWQPATSWAPPAASRPRAPSIPRRRASSRLSSRLSDLVRERDAAARARRASGRLPAPPPAASRPTRPARHLPRSVLPLRRRAPAPPAHRADGTAPNRRRPSRGSRAAGRRSLHRRPGRSRRRTVPRPPAPAATRCRLRLNVRTPDASNARSVDGRADDAAIRRLVATYGRAIESKDLALFRSVKPNCRPTRSAGCSRASAR